MRLFKKNNLILMIQLIFLSGCVSNSYFKIFHDQDGIMELIVTSDRIIGDCLDLEDDLSQKQKSKQGKNLFYLHVLDDENTVVEVGRDNIFETEYCQQYKKRLNKILTNSKRIYIGARGSFEKPRKTLKRTHQFQSGIYNENDRTLDLALIKGDNGQCIAMLTEEDTCSFSGLPLEKIPF
jgi:hypothetical protein